MRRHPIATRLGFGLIAASLGFSAALAQDLSADIKKDLPYLEKMYRYLHANPELSYREEETAALIAKELDGLGFDVTENVGRYADPELTAYGVVGVMKNGDGPTVMLRTDLDGLPIVEETGLDYASTVRSTEMTGQEVGVMHACAHDMHMSVFVGTARWLAANKDKWAGTLVMIGQPAEERGAGAKAMLDDGLFERFPKPDYNLGMHVWGFAPAGRVDYVPGYALANVDTVDIAVYGIGGHGSAPHMTRDPVVLAAQIITALQTIVSRETDPLDSAVVTVGSIHGGSKHNIISDQVDLQLTVRTYSDERREKVLASIRRISENMGRVAGLPDDRLPEVKIAMTEFTPATYNDPALTARIAEALKARFEDGVVTEGLPIMGGEDFSRFGRTEDDIPSLLLGLGGVDPEVFAAAQAEGRLLPSNHSAKFAPVIHPTLERGVEMMLAATLELMGR